MKKKVVLGILIGFIAACVLSGIALLIMYVFNIGVFEATVKPMPVTPNNPNVCYKPVIYLYPEQETEVTVKLDYNGDLFCTYPAYKNGWKVTAQSDGLLIDNQGKEYNYLFWEGISNVDYSLKEGFCVKGEDTEAFLEEALEKLGLNRKEANEFIVFWLPKMQNNEYNLISFAKEEYTDNAVLTVDPAPDTVIRVFMVWKSSETAVELPAQTFTAPEREGFTLVEWGGTEVE